MPPKKKSDGATPPKANKARAIAEPKTSKKAPPKDVDEAVYDPLHDTEFLRAAADDYTSVMADDTEGKKITHNEYCLRILEYAGFDNFSITNSLLNFFRHYRKDNEVDPDRFLDGHKGVPKVPGLPDLKFVAAALREGAGPTDVSVKEPSARAFEKRLADSFDKDKLVQQGYLHLRAFLTPHEAATMAEEVAIEAEEDHAHAKHKLCRTVGNGDLGCYHTPNPEKVPLVKALATAIEHFFVKNLKVEASNKTKVLRYGIGGKNYAHQDQNTYPYQATLMLSRPGIDFNGGALYLADPASVIDGSPVFIDIPWQETGDLVILSANGKVHDGTAWYHGKYEVTCGDVPEEKNHCLCVGFMQ